MFKKSALFLLISLSLVVLATYATNVSAARQLPSFYDSGVSIESAFQKADKPVLVEFYTDACSTCRQVTPVVHRLMTSDRFANRLTWVMVNLEDEANQPIAQLFGVRQIPDLYVFDVGRMKKHHIDIETIRRESDLVTAFDTALAKTLPLDKAPGLPAEPKWPRAAGVGQTQPTMRPANDVKSNAQAG
ncbi:MAG: thioredoxin family protein [Candidatus Melainabacteria bacterium]|nr:thioredoxin family protein [Candidatus Melainabacteria bacterium]